MDLLSKEMMIEALEHRDCNGEYNCAINLEDMISRREIINFIKTFPVFMEVDCEQGNIS